MKQLSNELFKWSQDDTETSVHCVDKRLIKNNTRVKEETTDYSSISGKDHVSNSG